MNVAGHWDSVFKDKAANEVSWYCSHLDLSLDMIQRYAPNQSASIIDVGAGESTLVDDLLARGYDQLTILDISPTAIDATKTRLGKIADSVHWMVGNITS